MQSLRNDLYLKVRKTVSFYSEQAVFMLRRKIYSYHKPRLYKPIFIIGCSRSGTTAVYRTFSDSHHLASIRKETHAMWDALHPASETGWDSHELTTAQATVADRSAVTGFYYTRLGTKRLVDKANQNCFRIPYLYALFPDASFVFVKRGGPDNINSLIHGWARPAKYGTWAADLPAEVRVDNGRYRAWCFFLFKGWRQFTTARIEEVCARQWLAANQAVLNAKSDVPSHQWAEIRYEDILSDAVTTFRNVFEHLGLPFDDPMEKYCATIVQNPTNAFSRPRLNKWKEENPERIERILPTIQDMMDRLGYQV